MFIIIYNYKSDQIVQDIVIDDIEWLVQDMIDEYLRLRRWDFISIYVPSDIARNIIGYMLENANDIWSCDDSDIQLLREDDNEVIITLSYDGGLCIEPAKTVKGNIKTNDGVLTYIYDSFAHKDVEEISSDEHPVLVFGFPEEPIELDESDDDNWENWEITEDKPTGITTFHKTEAVGDGYSSITFSSNMPYLVSEFAKNNISKIDK